MFGKTATHSAPSRLDSTLKTEASGHLNTINPGTTVEGNIISQGNIRFDGRLKGTLKCEGKLVVGSEGFIEGNIFCQQADISGKVRGNITVKDLVTLKNTADVTGDIITGKLCIEPGAVFTGRCNMHDNGGNAPQLATGGQASVQLSPPASVPTQPTVGSSTQTKPNPAPVEAK
ncbi:MAG: polymer-forming cytoskeletal protein [Flavobacteriales bacterium]|nr:polymer-forming cytoskeletal protein [Flavobacteriales bacterium]MCX7768311.1 polymer-forming cytoskeletal protein [Flavobacteriales bacterium]MDW8409939.1 polymer-forming cytoskeletal protein [Flavobacteriales bacterium]